MTPEDRFPGLSPRGGAPVSETSMFLPPLARAAAYCKAFSKWPASFPAVHGGRIYGMWMLGQNYRTPVHSKGFYGAYPPGYLERVGAFFPDAKDVCGDAHRLCDYFAPDSFDLIYADPPYSAEDAEHYGTPMIKRRKIMDSIHQVLRPGGWLVFLDQAWPQFSKKQFMFRGAIGAIRSTNHRVRAVFFFERIADSVAV